MHLAFVTSLASSERINITKYCRITEIIIDFTDLGHYWMLTWLTVCSFARSFICNTQSYSLKDCQKCWQCLQSSSELYLQFLYTSGGIFIKMGINFIFEFLCITSL